MVTKRLLFALAAAATLLGLVALAPAWGDDGEPKKTAAEKQAEEQAAGLKDLVTAGEVARFGREQKAPEALVTAAGLILKIDGEMKLGHLEATAEDEKGNKVKDGGEKVESLADQAQDLFDEATGLAKEAKLNLAPLIKAAKTRTARGRAPVGGPKRLTGRVDAGGRRCYTIAYEPNQTAAIALTSDRPVRFSVHQPGLGSLVNAIVNNAQYTWVPRGKGPVHVRVEVTGTNHVAKFAVYAN